MPPSDPAQVSAPAEKPLIFISCGQCTSEEIALGKAIEQVVRDTTAWDAYFAEQQNSLEGLASNILSSLKRCTGFVAVAHHRGRVQRPDDEIVRASVWVEQEIAIAAFIQNALQRKIEVALYIQKGIRREGIREQLRLAPFEFETADQVIDDFRRRVRTWSLTIAPTHLLVAEWKFKTGRQTQDHHDYTLVFDLINQAGVQITDWRIRVEVPRAFVKVGQGARKVVILEQDSKNVPGNARLYPGDRLPSVLSVKYFIDHANYDTIRPEAPAVKVSVWTGDTSPWITEIPLSQLNEF
jgi:hypothetical protein